MPSLAHSASEHQHQHHDEPQSTALLSLNHHDVCSQVHDTCRSCRCTCPHHHDHHHHRLQMLCLHCHHSAYDRDDGGGDDDGGGGGRCLMRYLHESQCQLEDDDVIVNLNHINHMRRS